MNTAEKSGTIHTMFPDAVSLGIFVVLLAPCWFIVGQALFGIRQSAEGFLAFLVGLAILSVPGLNFVRYGDYHITIYSWRGIQQISLAGLLNCQIEGNAERGEVYAIALNFADGSQKTMLTKPFSRSSLKKFCAFLLARTDRT